ncbi:MAG: 30S ribosomal protein S8 [Candidatus Nanoarchaeia archaeon]|nr:30S ribosomal protein S8 [Candidatus Nanoarchaeia archaeon]
MSLNDPLANVLSKISNATKIGKFEVLVENNSNLIKKVLSIMKDSKYITSVEEIEDSKGNFLKIILSGNLNNCGVIKPRFAVKLEDYEKFEKRFLLAKNFGFLLVSTNQGLMTHNEAKDKNLGGKLISFCY